MSDDKLVTRLRNYRPDTLSDAGLHHDAADAIERAREIVRGMLSAETATAKTRGLSDCCCIMRSRALDRAYEAGTCPHQKARAFLAQHDTSVKLVNPVSGGDGGG